MAVAPFVTAGELRQRVSIYSPVGTTSATGGVVEGAPDLMAERIPAAITSGVLSEALRASALTSSVTHIVRIRYIAGLKPYMSVRFETREFQILSIIDVDERHIEQQLICAEIQ